MYIFKEICMQWLQLDNHCLVVALLLNEGFVQTGWGNGKP